jgi:hypothetical protein
MNEPACPACSKQVPWPEVSFGPPFDCPHCGTELLVALSYRTALSVCSLALSLVIVYFLGAHDLLFLLGVLLAFFPLMMGMVIVAKALLPPRLHLGDRADLDLRGVRRRP